MVLRPFIRTLTAVDTLWRGTSAQIYVVSVSCLIVLRFLHELLIQTPLEDQ